MNFKSLNFPEKKYNKNKESMHKTALNQTVVFIIRIHGKKTLNSNRNQTRTQCMMNMQNTKTNRDHTWSK